MSVSRHSPRRIVLLAAAVGVLCAAGGSFALLHSGRGAGSRSQAPKLLGRTDPSTLVDFSLVLRLPGQRRLSRFLAALYDPSSPSYRRFIDAKTFGERFGVTRHALDGVVRALRVLGVIITGEYPQRTALDARAPAGVISHLFGVRLMEYMAPDGRRFHAPAAAPVIPSRFRGTVSAVAGLDGREVARTDDVPGGGLTPTGASLAYDITPLRNQNIQGQGEKLAVVALATFKHSDIDSFDQQSGLPPLSVRDVPIPAPIGGATDSSADGQSEVALDLEVAHAIAPQAQILDYNAPGQDALGADTLGAIIDKIVADGQASIVSDSWGECELLIPRSDVERGEHSIEAAVAHGISIFKSTGDAGAYTCQRFSSRDHRLSVEWPSSSPGVVAVGGTSLSVRQSGAYGAETAWEGVLSQSGGGGGESAVFPRPGWQRGAGVLNRFSDGERQLPDVSADADPDTGWAIVQDGRLDEAGGTSASSPFWAASTLLVDEYARQQGAGRLGFVAPLLYAIAGNDRPARAFHDVTVGTNRYYPATHGWDFATGLGSPDVYALARDVVFYLERHRHSR